MAGDLSTVQHRQTAQDRLTNRRSGVLPEKRDTRLPEAKFYGDMRSANRGDGGAEHLRAMFGAVQKAGESFQDYANAKQDETNKANTAEGQRDSLTGDEDKGLSAKSRAYRTAYTTGRSERDTLAFMDTTDKEMQAVLNNPEGELPDMEDVDEFIHDRMKSFLKNEDGTPRDFGSPEATSQVFAHLRRWSTEVRQKASEHIVEQVNTETLNNASEVLRGRLKTGVPTTLQDYHRLIPDTVPLEKQQAAFLGAVQGSVEELKTEAFDAGTPPARRQELINRAVGILRMVRGEVATAAGENASAADLASEEAVLNSGDDPAPAKPAAAPAAAPKPVRKGKPISRDEAIRHVLIDLEGGGAVVDNGEGAGTTKYGITTKHNPGVDVANLTEAQATDIAKRKYWFKELDSADPVVAAIAFDAGYIGGTTQGKKLLAAANGDPERALAIYRARLNWLADNNPKLAKFKKGWNNRLNKLANKLGLSGDGDASSDVSLGSIIQIPVVDGNVPRAPSTADMAEDTPLSGAAPALAGRGFTLNQAQRNQLHQYTQGFLKEVKVEDERIRTEKHQEGSRTLLARFIGIGGAKPTVSDIQQMILNDEISPEVGYQTVQRLETDAREERAEGRAVRAEQASDRAEARERQKERSDRRINAFLEPVFSGRMKVSEAKALLLARSNAITDVDERNEFRQSVYRELEGLGTLRTESAPYQDYMVGVDTLAQSFKAEIPATTRGQVRKRLEDRIDALAAQYKVRAGRRGQDEGANMADLWKQTDKAFNDWFAQNIEPQFRARR